MSAVRYSTEESTTSPATSVRFEPPNRPEVVATSAAVGVRPRRSTNICVTQRSFEGVLPASGFDVSPGCPWYHWYDLASGELAKRNDCLPAAIEKPCG